MKAVIIIPARYKSSRFPGKPLTPILGKPMILWVAEICIQALPSEFVYIATDDLKIKKVVEEAGFNVVMTSEKALTGTDRIADAANQIDADIYINVQGDEPLLDPNDILSILEVKKKYPNEIINGYCKIGDNEDAESLNIPSVRYLAIAEFTYRFKYINNTENYWYAAISTGFGTSGTTVDNTVLTGNAALIPAFRIGLKTNLSKKRAFLIEAVAESIAVQEEFKDGREQRTNIINTKLAVGLKF